MSQTLHNHKSKLVKEGSRGKDERVDFLLDNPSSELASLFSRAEEISRNKLKRGYVESCLFCSSDLGRISEILEVPKDLLEVYQEFFFSVQDWDRLTKIEHIESLPSSREDESMLKLWALNHGLDFIAWRVGKSVTISPVNGLQDLFNICVYKSKEAMYNSSASETSKESVKWVKMSTDISRLLKAWTMDSSAAKRDLELAIKTVVPDFEGIDSLLAEDGFGED